MKYTCPMHPQIVQEGPGACPICGMSLEPMLPVKEEDLELKRMSLRFWISLILTIPMILPLGLPVMGMAFLATPVVLWGAFPFFERGWKSILNRSLNMFTLIATGIGTAYLYSLYALWAHLDVYFEVASAITVLVLLGQVLELRARKKTSAAIQELPVKRGFLLGIWQQFL